LRIVMMQSATDADLMMYSAYQAQSDFLDPLRGWAQLSLQTFRMMSRFAGPFTPPGLNEAAAAAELISRARMTHTRPPFNIPEVLVGNEMVPVTERVLKKAAFGTLLHFDKALTTPQPKVLVVAPLSGHFATLLRSTVKTMLSDHDVYITDWHNARDVPLSSGRFGFDDYVDHLIDFIETIGPRTHVVAVCQPCVQALVAAAVMADKRHPAQPASMTLMAGPIDTRINPTKVNELAMSKPIEWFEKNLLAEVPSRLPGAGRKVYPGFIQLSAFMAMNMQRHVRAHLDLYEHLAKNETEKAETIKTFYDEYFAVLDLPAEFYIETVRDVFQDALLPRGELTWHGEKVKPAAIKKTALLTVEGERDDICALGQTVAAHDLCTGIKPYMKKHHMQPGVGHYGVFSGRKWEGQIYPIVRNMILANP
jgi:poly(3-hydroxybutyrate) depolymerase